MVRPDIHDTAFGCPKCWPASADAAWDARQFLERGSDLIDDSHLHVMVLACRECRQQFLSVFTEVVDWSEGDDAQYWTLLPLTSAEAALLVGPGGAIALSQLNALGRSRRSLNFDDPTGQDARCYWTTGVRLSSPG